MFIIFQQIIKSKLNFHLTFGLLVLLFGAGCMSTSIANEIYRGWEESLAISKGDTLLRVIPAAGGRIIHYGINDKNIIYEHQGADGKTFEKTGHWFMVGGYQLDLGPEIRGIPPHMSLWLGKYKLVEKNGKILLKSDISPELGMQLEKEIFFKKNGALAINQTMINWATKEQSYCLWDRTLCKGGGFVLLPLNLQSRFLSGWVIQKGKKYSANKPSSKYIKIINGILIAKATGKGTKIGCDSNAGWIAYVLGKQLFVKSFPYYKEGKYTDAGNTVEVYFNNELAELEPLSPEVKLSSGKSYIFPEEWHIIKLKNKVTTFAEASELISQIKTILKERKGQNAKE